jgi:DNA (cytosine-5)-methyltransferase 1
MKIIEMFAGVGGFRVGLEKVSPEFQSVWANQWEPGTKKQHAWEMYEKNFGSGSCLNEDITKVDVSDIPSHDLLTAGFPCQDYSVAKSLKYSGGIEGKKGVLWWEIVKVLEKKQPSFALLENVDRLLVSPAKQRGRDFAIILKSLSDLGYFVEWRVVNAAEYGMPQKRKRVFILAINRHHPYAKNLEKNVLAHSILNDALPIETVDTEKLKEVILPDTLLEVSEKFGLDSVKSPFLNSGYSTDKIYTYQARPAYKGKYITLGSIVENAENVPKEFWISAEEIKGWESFKLGKRVERTDPVTGHKYMYSEGRMAFPDSLDKAARTIITGEGGKAPSRFKHVIEQNGQYRRLTPVEIERINMFADNHTEGVSDVRRAFLMGNALVTGVVTKIGKSLLEKTR